MSLQKKLGNRRSRRGQILLMFAIALPVVLLFTGLAIDMGSAYITKTTLSKAVDAAALAAMRNYSQGQTQAQAIAQSAFNVNYQSAFGISTASPPVLNVAFTTDASNNKVVNVSATATINTFFLRTLAGYQTLTISTSAQATRPKLIMSLVLDRSGSMNRNGGATALPPAVNAFLTNFDDATDEVAMVSFSTRARVDVPIETNFTSPIDTAVNAMAFGGGTYSQSGMSSGQAQIDSVPVSVGEAVVKVAIFFTDGWANMIQDNLNCPPTTNLEFGGCAPPEAAVGWCSGIAFVNPTTGSSTSCGASQFPSQSAGGNVALTESNIATDAMYRTVLVAQAMQAEGIVIYSIGLGDKISQTFLQQVANDPASPTFNGNLPIGEAVFAPTASQLDAVFQTIAAQISLRLSQ
ncbi:MAG TPA: VWA domain-containing protein [Candidatus Binataceae bacterium]|nr:VWA domain-containing protein [Candidatus Binataceae bacterium]